MSVDFSKIRGPKSSVQENFEQLVCQLLSLEFNALSINGRGGDGGIDCYLNTNKEEITIFQMKYFLNPLNSGQKQQIKKSLVSAKNNKNIGRWILVIPHDHTPAEKEWFEKLDDEINLDWWGETVLRNLLLKHPYISNEFFDHDVLLKEFSKFKTEITSLINIINYGGNPKKGIRADANNDAIEQYISRAEKIFRLALIDDEFFNNSDNKLLAVDVFDLVNYAGIYPKFKTLNSVSDFCFENSPLPLTILPSSKIELFSLLNDSISKSKSVKSYSQPRKIELVLADFLREYERNPISPDTRKLYEALIGPSTESVSAARGFTKLNEFIQSGKLQISNDGTNVSRVQVSTIFDEMAYNLRFVLAGKSEEEKFRFLESRYRMVSNLVYLQECWTNSPQQIRMISSNPSFIREGQKIFNGHGPVRDLHEYVYSLFSNKFENEWKLEQKAILSAIQILKQINHYTDYGSGQAVEHILENKVFFDSFLLYYKKNLRTVDLMVQQEFVAAQSLLLDNISEFYNFLKKQSSLIQAFQDWIDYIINILESFEKRNLTIDSDEIRENQLKEEIIRKNIF